MMDEKIDNVGDISNFEFLYANCLYNDEFKFNTLESLKLFFREDAIFDKSGIFYFGDFDDEKWIHKNNFHIVQNYIKEINCIKVEEEPDYNPANEEARKFIQELKLKKQKMQKAKKETDINLFSIISSIAWKTHIGINNVWDLTIYQLYDAFYRLEVIDNYDKTLNGIYAGTLDSRKIDLKKINWAKIIDLNKN